MLRNNKNLMLETSLLIRGKRAWPLLENAVLAIVLVHMTNSNIVVFPFLPNSCLTINILL